MKFFIHVHFGLGSKLEFCVGMTGFFLLQSKNFILQIFYSVNAVLASSENILNILMY